MIGASTERPPGSSDRPLIRHQKNRRPAEGLPIIPRHSENTITANAGRCASRPRPGRSIPGDGGGTAPPRVGKILRRTNLSGYARAPRLPPPQMRANAYTASTGAGGNAVLIVIPAGCSSPGKEGLLKSPSMQENHRHSGESQNPFYDFAFVFAFASDSREVKHDRGGPVEKPAPLVLPLP